LGSSKFLYRRKEGLMMFEVWECPLRFRWPKTMGDWMFVGIYLVPRCVEGRDGRLWVFRPNPPPRLLPLG
jgi:hypothetical protein